MGISIRKWNLYVKMFYQYIMSYRCVKNASFLDSEHTVHDILMQEKSLIRYGDGEFDLMEGKSIHYQKFTPDLKQKLYDILNDYIAKKGKTNYIIGMPHAFLLPSGYFMLRSRVLLSCWSHTRYYFKKYFDKEVLYGDACLFSKGAEVIYQPIWTDTKIEQVIFVHNNIKYAEGFERKYHIITKFVEIPPQNAFDELERIYGDIINRIEQGSADLKTMVLISAGPCGKILSYRLTQNGIWAIDTGHCWDDPLKSIVDF